jgi:hypothetical protein
MEGAQMLEFLKAMEKGIKTQIGSLASKMDKDREEILERLEAKIESNQAKTDLKLKKMSEEIFSIRSEPDRDRTANSEQTVFSIQ